MSIITNMHLNWYYKLKEKAEDSDDFESQISENSAHYFSLMSIHTIQYNNSLVNVSDLKLG